MNTAQEIVSQEKFSFSLVPSAVYRRWWRFCSVRDETEIHRVVTFWSTESENTVGALKKKKDAQ